MAVPLWSPAGRLRDGVIHEDDDDSSRKIHCREEGNRLLLHQAQKSLQTGYGNVIGWSWLQGRANRDGFAGTCSSTESFGGCRLFGSAQHGGDPRRTCGILQPFRLYTNQSTPPPSELSAKMLAPAFVASPGSAPAVSNPQVHQSPSTEPTRRAPESGTSLAAKASLAGLLGLGIRGARGARRGARAARGKATTRNFSELAASGDWYVIMACRDYQKAEKAARDAGMLEESYEVLHCDLASTNSVRHFVKAFQSLGRPLDALVVSSSRVSSLAEVLAGLQRVTR
eukprot:s2137_g7.t1